MPDMNQMLAAEQLANSANHRSAYQATAPSFGLNEQAVAMNTEAPLPSDMQGFGGNMPMQNPADLLKAQSEPTEQPLSLKKLKKKEKEKVLQAFITARKTAESHYSTTVEPKIIKRRDIYNAEETYYDNKYPKLSESTKWVSKDVKTACEWIQTSLMEVFTGGEDPLSVKGVNVNDDGVAEKIQMLVKYQLEKKNDWFQFVKTMVGYALSENFAVAKVWWKREEKRTQYKMLVNLNDMEQVASLVMNGLDGTIENIKSKDVKDAPDLMEITYDKVQVTKNHPVVEYVPTSELRYTPDAAVLQDCKFVAHRKIVNGDYLKRRERDGIYENIDKALKEYSHGNTTRTPLDYRNDKDRYDKKNHPNDSDMASMEVELYEAYLKVDYNNDGVFENLIVHAIGDNLIRVVENDFEFPPFFVCSSFYDPNAVFNKDSFTDTLEQLQDLKTALMRQIIINVAKNNSPRVFVNERSVDMDAMLAGEEMIAVQNNLTDSVFCPPSLPLSSVTMEVIQYAQNEIESQSGSTRYNQGLDSNSLNKTATGVTAVMGASEKRNKLIARSIAERFFIPIYKFLILLNQKYLEDEQMIRLTDKNVAIRKEDLDIDYDLIVNVGQGMGTKESTAQYLMMVLQQIYPIAAQQGIVNPKSWYNLIGKLLDTIGLRDVGMYMLDPESAEAQQAAEQAQQAAAQAQAEALQNSLQLSIAKSSVPRVTMNVTDLPPDAVKAYLEQKLGIITDEKSIAEHEVMMRNA